MADEGLLNTHLEKSLDVDLPNFQSTKYNPIWWKIIHGTAYFLFALGWTAAEILLKYYPNMLFKNIINIIASAMYVICTTIEWLHFRRGCIGLSNLNSILKTNIDKSWKASLMRSETGIKYFFSVIGSLIMLIGSLLVFSPDSNGELYINSNNFTLASDIAQEITLLYLCSMIMVSIAQICKVEKILTKTKQYTFKKDKSNLLVELFAMFGGIICVIGYLIREFKGNVNRFSIIDTYLCIGGGALFFVSALSMQYRYYLSGYEDLNMSMVSDYTI